MPYAAPVKDEPPRRPAENRVGASETPAASMRARNARCQPEGRPNR